MKLCKRNSLLIGLVVALMMLVAGIFVTTNKVSADEPASPLASTSFTFGDLEYRVGGDLENAGIGYVVSINAAEYDSLIANYDVTIGVLLIPRDIYIADNFNLDNLNNGTEDVTNDDILNAVASAKIANGSNYDFKVVLREIPAAKRITEIKAKAYIKVTDKASDEPIENPFTEIKYSKVKSTTIGYLAHLLRFQDTYAVTTTYNALSAQERTIINSYSGLMTQSIYNDPNFASDYKRVMQGQIFDVEYVGAVAEGRELIGIADFYKYNYTVNEISTSQNGYPVASMEVKNVQNQSSAYLAPVYSDSITFANADTFRMQKVGAVAYEDGSAIDACGTLKLHALLKNDGAYSSHLVYSQSDFSQQITYAIKSFTPTGGTEILADSEEMATHLSLNGAYLTANTAGTAIVTAKLTAFGTEFTKDITVNVSDGAVLRNASRSDVKYSGAAGTLVHAPLYENSALKIPNVELSTEDPTKGVPSGVTLNYDGAYALKPMLSFWMEPTGQRTEAITLYISFVDQDDPSNYITLCLSPGFFATGDSKYLGLSENKTTGIADEKFAYAYAGARASTFPEFTDYDTTANNKTGVFFGKLSGANKVTIANMFGPNIQANTGKIGSTTISALSYGYNTNYVSFSDIFKDIPTLATTPDRVNIQLFVYGSSIYFYNSYQLFELIDFSEAGLTDLNTRKVNSTQTIALAGLDPAEHAWTGFGEDTKVDVYIKATHFTKSSGGSCNQTGIMFRKVNAAVPSAAYAATWTYVQAPAGSLGIPTPAVAE